MAHHVTGRLLRGLTFSNVCSFLALMIALGTGTAYAANTIGSDDIIDESIQSVDIKNNEVKSVDIKPGNVTTSDLRADAVDSSKVVDGSIGASDLADSAVGSAKLIDGAVTNFKIGAGAVTNSKLGTNSVVGSNVATNSLTLADLLGADISGHISFTLQANACGTLNFSVGGAQVGQVALFSFTGDVAVPSTVVFGGTKVAAAGSVTVRACNTSASAFTVSGLGIRVVTFG